MSDRGLPNPYHISKERLETMVDAIFAFAMTLLVLGIGTPAFPTNQANSVLPEYISHLIPQVVLFVTAFLILSLFWLEHHRQFYYVRSVNPAILWLNIAILIFIVMIPFTTDVSGDYDGVQIAVLLFHVNFLAIGALFLHTGYTFHGPAASALMTLPKSGVDKVMVPCTDARMRDHRHWYLVFLAVILSGSVSSHPGFYRCIQVIFPLQGR